MKKNGGKNLKTRIEKDLLGDIAVPIGALWGAHTARARENFPLSGRPVNPALIHAYGAVKLACARTNQALAAWGEDRFQAIETACGEMMAGELDEHVVVDALQGGAGTSTNMNVNEVIANRALVVLGERPGSYSVIHPIEDINKHQSTNDTYPTALKVAAIKGVRGLERNLVALMESFQGKEREFARVVKIGRTQTRDAVLTTMGRTFSSFAEAFGRDRWRVYKCEERLRVVNLGGTAIGTGLGAPRKYIFKVVNELKSITGFGLARAENLVEGTQNLDVLAEVHGILKACAVNLLKVSGDLRWMSSGPDAGLGEIKLPPRQAGSSIMPDKVNPVVPEAASQAAMTVMANDVAVNQATAAGSLELNPFGPLIADALLGSLDCLNGACRVLAEFCVDGLTVDEERCRRQVENSTATVTALLETIGYEKAQKLALESAASGASVRELALAKKLMSAEEFDQLTSAEAVTRLGSAPR